MYALSVFDTETDYNSVLSMDTDNFIQPDMMHVIWGFSKVCWLLRHMTLESPLSDVQLKVHFTGSLFGQLSYRSFTHS